MTKIKNSKSGRTKFIDIEDVLFEFSHDSQIFLYESGNIKAERKA